ncbi:hypothetical protein PRZ48_011164 [Zasmidium cellare]|uniref:DUF1993 domain-containing protein n=1 Tax=Zasmidium cellare TaxID=395010 RepID=A0ABR0EB70_ZASCE|nr:hypothetical protein PRZ48_011164 [Zasmidium cellare]
MASLYDLSVPLFVRELTILNQILHKGEEYCNKHDLPHSLLLEGKLAEDMLPLTFQIQSASNTAKGILHRIGGSEETPIKDDETTFPELYARVEKTIALLKAANKETFVDPFSPCHVKLSKRTLDFPTALMFLQNFAMPNFFFHVVTAYGILRKEGVEVGKLDFLGMGSITEEVLVGMLVEAKLSMAHHLPDATLVHPRQPAASPEASDVLSSEHEQEDAEVVDQEYGAEDSRDDHSIAMLFDPVEQV